MVSERPYSLPFGGTLIGGNVYDSRVRVSVTGHSKTFYHAFGLVMRETHLARVAIALSPSTDDRRFFAKTATLRH